MKIILKETEKTFLKKIRNKFKKSFELNKNIGENILFAGSDGTGMSSSFFYLFDYFLKNEYMKEHSIFIDLKFSNDLYIKWLSTLNNYTENNINKNDFILFNLDDKNEKNFFNKLDLSSESFQSVIKKHTFIMGLSDTLYRSGNKDKLYNLLKNLKENKGKEIPIFIEYIYFRNKKEYEDFIDISKIINKKGYFIICSTQSLDILPQSPKKINSVFKHIFHFKTEIVNPDIKNILTAHKLTERDVRNQSVGEYYYINDLKTIEPVSNVFPYKDIKLIKRMPETNKIRDIYLSNKINNF